MNTAEAEQAMINALQETAKRELHDCREKYGIPQTTLANLWFDVKVFLDPRAEMYAHIRKDEDTKLSLIKPFGDQLTQNIRGIRIKMPQYQMDMSIGFSQQKNGDSLALVAVESMIQVNDHTTSRYNKQYIIERNGDDFRFWHLLYGWPNWQEISGDLSAMGLTRELFQAAKNRYIQSQSRGSDR